MYLFKLERDEYTDDTTLGKLYKNDGLFFCYTLEDTVRAPGIKVKGHTAIPEGRYKVTLRYSNKFKRDCPVLSNTDDPNIIKRGNVIFKYVMFHGGNRHQDTEGCPLVAHNRSGETIQGTAEKELTALIKKHLETDEVFVDVINLLQNG